jgi:GNAT superfamily N-acetyltransferase
MNLSVRVYEPGDQPGVEWLYQRTPPAGLTYVRAEPLPPDLKGIRENYEAFWVAVEPTPDGDAVVGITALRDARQPSLGVPAPGFVDLSQPTARLHHVMVVPERQRRGIGRKLMHEATDWARASGYQRLVLETASEQEGAIAFYRAIGMKELGRSTFKRWEMVWFGLNL